MITVHKPLNGRPYNKDAVNKGWWAEIELTLKEIQRLHRQNLLSEVAHIKNANSNGRFTLFETFDNFKLLSPELIGSGVIDTPQVRTKEYKDINLVTSHEQRYTNTVSDYLARHFKETERRVVTGVTFQLHKSKEGVPNSEPDLVTIYPANNEAFALCPPTAPCFYRRTTNNPAYCLTYREYNELKPMLEAVTELSNPISRFYEQTPEMFGGLNPKQRSEFVVPDPSKEEFYLTDHDTGEVVKASHRQVSGEAGNYGETISLQEVQVMTGNGIEVGTYGEFNSRYRPSSPAEIEHYKRTENLSEQQATGRQKSTSLVDLMKSYRTYEQSQVNEYVGDTFKPPKRVPDTIMEFTLTDGSKVYQFQRLDLVRAQMAKENHSDEPFKLPDPKQAKIDDRNLWLTERGKDELVEELAVTPNINNPSEMLFPQIKSTDKAPRAGYRRSVPFDPHFLANKSLLPGAPLTINGKAGTFYPFQSVRPNTQVFKYRSNNNGVKDEILLPSDMTKDSVSLKIRGERFERVGGSQSTRSLYQVEYDDGTFAFYQANEFFNLVEPPRNEQYAGDVLGKVGISEDKMMLLADQLDDTEKEQYLDILAQAGFQVQKSGTQFLLEAENEGQTALFGSAKDILQKFGSTAIRRVNTKPSKPSRTNEVDMSMAQQVLF